MVTAKMRCIANGLARRNGTALHGVVMIASEMGSVAWKGCIPGLRSYVPNNRVKPQRERKPLRFKVREETDWYRDFDLINFD